MSETARVISRDLQELAAIVDKWLRRKAPGQRIAFSLWVWTPEFVNYIANTKDRAEIIAALESTITKWKQGMPDIPAHDRQ